MMSTASSTQSASWTTSERDRIFRELNHMKPCPILAPTAPNSDDNGAFPPSSSTHDLLAVLVIGSRLWGTATPASDLDCVIIHKNTSSSQLSKKLGVSLAKGIDAQLINVAELEKRAMILQFLDPAACASSCKSGGSGCCIASDIDLGLLIAICVPDRCILYGETFIKQFRQRMIGTTSGGGGGGGGGGGSGRPAHGESTTSTTWTPQPLIDDFFTQMLRAAFFDDVLKKDTNRVEKLISHGDHTKALKIVTHTLRMAMAVGAVFCQERRLLVDADFAIPADETVPLSRPLLGASPALLPSSLPPLHLQQMLEIVDSFAYGDHASLIYGESSDGQGNDSLPDSLRNFCTTFF